MAWQICLTCAIFNLAGRGVAESFSVFLVSFEQDFPINRSSLTGIYSLYALMVGIGGISVGKSLEWFGPRKIYAGGAILTGAACLIASMAENITLLYLGLGLTMGIGVAAVGLIPASLLLRKLASNKLTTMLAVVHGAAGLGTLLVVPLSHALIESIGWRGAYRVLACFLFALLLFFALPSWRNIVSPTLDTAESGAASSIRERGDGGITLRAALRQRGFWACAGAFFFTSVSVYLVVPQLVLMLISTGYSQFEASLIFGVNSASTIVGVICTGWAFDRYASRTTALVSYGLTLSGLVVLLAMTWFGASIGLAGLLVGTFGLSIGARYPMVAVVTAKLFAGPRFGSIFGVIAVIAGTGAAFGAWASGVLFDWTASYQPILLCAMVAAAIGATIFVAVPEMQVIRRGHRP